MNIEVRGSSMFGGYLGFSQRWRCNTITLTFLGISLTQSAVHVFFSGTILFTEHHQELWLMVTTLFFVTDVLYNWISKIRCTNVWRRNLFWEIVSSTNSAN